MKLLPIVAFAVLVLSPTGAFARDGEHSQRDIKLLNDAAAALSTSNPDLSTRLKEFVVKEAGETEESTAEPAGAQTQDIQLLKDSAAALDASNPKLAKGLRKLARKEANVIKMTPAEPKIAPTQGY